MPTPIVHDPRQNYHGWWGTLTVAEDENGVQNNHGLQLDSKDPNCLHVFLKANRDSHFVAQGTAVEALEFLGGSTSEAMKKLETINEAEDLGLTEEAMEFMAADLKRLDGKGDVRIYMLRAINPDSSTALSRVHSLTTEACFNNDHWLRGAGEIGQRNIVLGRQLKRLKTKGAMSMSPTN